MLIICGDFQAHRNRTDLDFMAVPQKYKHLGDFHKYYEGTAQAPVLTVVIGGNHEASNYLWELYHGGWLAPNIYFLGFSGCIQVNGIRIAGSSGIYKSHDYHLGYYEKMPYDNSTMRSIYHTRKYDVTKLSQLSRPDIFLSHDWPKSIEHYGNTSELLRRKPHFREDSQSGTLGSPPMLHLLKTLQPELWFSAHMHVKFEATFKHVNGVDGSSNVEATASKWQQDPPIEKNPDEIQIDDLDVEAGGVTTSTINDNPDEIVLNDEIDQVASQSNSTVQPFSSMSSRETKFLALDKCLPGRRFLEVMDIPKRLDNEEKLSSPCITFDPEWLVITRAFHTYLSLDRYQTPIPRKDELEILMETERAWVKQNLPNGGLVEINQIQQFVPTAPNFQPGRLSRRQQPQIYTNPQTEALMTFLQLPNKINPQGGQVVSPPNHHQPSITTTSRPIDTSIIADGKTGRHSPFTEDQSIDAPSVNQENDSLSRGGWSPSRVME